MSTLELNCYSRLDENIEIMWSMLSSPHQRKILLATVYCPPQGNVAIFCEYIKDTLVNMNLKENVEVIIMGD